MAEKEAEKKAEKEELKEIEKTEKIKFSLRKKITWFIILIIIGVMLISSISILNNQKQELTRQFELRGGAIATTLADSIQVRILDILEKLGTDKISKRQYGEIVFDLAIPLTDTLKSIIGQENIVGAVVINQYNEVLLHSNPSVDQLSVFKNLPGKKLYTDLYKEGEDITPKIQPYSGKFYNSKTKREETGEIIDISYPIIGSKAEKNIKKRNGEVHIYVDKAAIAKTIRKAAATIQGVAVFAIVIGIVCAFMLAALIVRPIKKLVSAMRKVAKGDLNQNVNVKSKDEVGMLARNFNKMTEGLREKEKIKSTFNKFVSEEIAREVLSNESALKLGGDKKNVTVFFSDIRNFTPISEKLSAHEVVSMLNEYLSIMTDIVVKYKGVIDKYIGDEIMAIYGAPIAHDNDPLNAVKTAVEMMKDLGGFNEKRRTEGKVELDIGIGINTGDVISGNMGSEKRMDYTVIGDNVNLASRLCDTAGKKGLKNILITESTYIEVKDHVIVNEIEPVYVKGKERPVKIYELLDVK